MRISIKGKAILAIATSQVEEDWGKQRWQ